jgi:hypothetical protein
MYPTAHIYRPSLIGPKKTSFLFDWGNFCFEVTPVTSSSFTATVASESFNDARIVFYDLENSWVTI